MRMTLAVFVLSIAFVAIAIAYSKKEAAGKQAPAQPAQTQGAGECRRLPHAYL